MNKKQTIRFVSMLCPVCSTLITVKSTLDDPINVKVEFFARRCRYMQGTHFIFIFFTKKCEAAGKKCEASRLADYISGETLLQLFYPISS